MTDCELFDPSSPCPRFTITEIPDPREAELVAIAHQKEKEDAYEELISCHKTRKHLFESSKSGLKHAFLYAQISTTLNKAGHTQSMKQCKGAVQGEIGCFEKDIQG